MSETLAGSVVVGVSFAELVPHAASTRTSAARRGKMRRRRNDNENDSCFMPESYTTLLGTNTGSIPYVWARGRGNLCGSCASVPRANNAGRGLELTHPRCVRACPALLHRHLCASGPHDACGSCRDEHGGSPTMVPGHCGEAIDRWCYAFWTARLHQGRSCLDAEHAGCNKLSVAIGPAMSFEVAELTSGPISGHRACGASAPRTHLGARGSPGSASH